MTKQALMDKIKDLERESKFKEKEFGLRAQEIRLEEKQTIIALREAKVTVEAKAEQLQKRIDEHPYRQLTDLLKAIAVKLPELNIKELAIHTKSKK